MIKAFSTVAKQMATATVVFHGRQSAGRNHQQPGEYAVDDGPTEECILILGEEGALPGLTLPVTTLSGALMALHLNRRFVLAAPLATSSISCRAAPFPAHRPVGWRLCLPLLNDASFPRRAASSGQL
jgi:hypothetical protein